MTPLITIGATAYQAENSIERAVSSALRQDWPGIEIVIVDDGSTDGTWNALQRLAASHKEIRAFRQETNQGVGSARSRIVREARGAFICFFDDDDESAPDRVRRQLERILNYEAQSADGAPVICHTARRQVLLQGAHGSNRPWGSAREFWRRTGLRWHGGSWRGAARGRVWCGGDMLADGADRNLSGAGWVRPRLPAQRGHGSRRAAGADGWAFRRDRRAAGDADADADLGQIA
ncbi:glycosyltransferase family 2 protein [Devosia chinhatensis]|uniref:Glycosyltransferase family 2 protein n=1 Tax=Devosia aurantiaca TaxID=2714858 RepID=A0A6M1ST63_9HYPH|nr:glycosyltransferase family 2 protein [Devosia aurantiaca]